MVHPCVYFQFSIVISALIGSGLCMAQSSGSIVVEKPFSRATPPSAKVGAGYMTITNKGNAADRLVSASSPAAGRVEIHEMTVENGVAKMRGISGGLAIGTGKTVLLSPGGYHLMMMDLKKPFKTGDKVPVTLNFEKAGKVNVTLDVGSPGAMAPNGMSMPSEQKHKM
jgi:periplasmic copper chaperone A